MNPRTDLLNDPPGGGGTALTFGERINQLRCEKKLTLRELSRRLELTHVFLRDIESGKRYPSQTVLRRLAKALDVELHVLERLDPRIQIGELSKLTQKDTSLAFEFNRLIEQVVSGRVSAADLRKRNLAVDRRR